jgi:hypothetical protein
MNNIRVDINIFFGEMGEKIENNQNGKTHLCKNFTYS